MQKISVYFRNPKSAMAGVMRNTCSFMPDKLYLSIMYKLCCNEELHWDNPQKFCEKIQWLKLYDRKPEYTTMVDKYAVKDYVASIIGENFIIPTLGVWDRPEDIDFESLPDSFVLKTTHGGGSLGVVICKDINCFDRKSAIKHLKKSLRQDIYKQNREWPYKDVPRRIIAEKFIGSVNEPRDLHDYKFYCFGGRPKLLYITSNRQGVEGLCEDFFDIEGHFLNIQQRGEKNSPNRPSLPENLREMRQLAEKLSQNIPQVRIDFYEVEGKVYFGEMTFYDGSGFYPFQPEEWEYEIGSWIKLPI